MQISPCCKSKIFWIWFQSVKNFPSINRYITICNYDKAGCIIRKCSPWLRARESICLENLLSVYGTVFIQEPLLQKHIKFRSNAVRCKWLRRHVSCIEKPGIILFTKDATCFARKHYDYKILVYNLTLSTQPKTCFDLARPLQMRNTRTLGLFLFFFPFGRTSYLLLPPPPT